MKIKWSAFFSLALLLSLVGCGAEQFGSVPQSTSSDPDPIKVGEQLSCTSHTLIKPKVDILYVFDNTDSYQFAPSTLKNAVANTMGTVSQQFDYRIISTSLVNPTGNNPYTDFSVLTNSRDPLGNVTPVSSPGEMLFYATVPQGDMAREVGLSRVHDFINHHRVGATPLFRQNAYTFIVLISNSFDSNIELAGLNGYPNTYLTPNAFPDILAKYQSLKNSLNAKQLRMLSVTAHTAGCNGNAGWHSSKLSYVKMSESLHSASDSFDLCSKPQEISKLFEEVNSTIQQVIVPHVYKYWPITLANQSIPLDAPEQNINQNSIQVFKTSPNGAPVPIPRTGNWTLRDFGSVSNRNILTTTNPSQYESGRHFIEFTGSNKPTYPDCIQVKSTTKVERFGYIVLPRKPKIETIHVVIGKNAIPHSDWEYTEAHLVYPKNIKILITNEAGIPIPDSDKPEVMRNGYMIKLKNGRYYESGQNVQVNYLPDSIN